MIAFALYLLKVFVCSGILFLYYHLALRNKLFHQWNRFYLLVAVVVSLVVPAAEVTISHLNSETPKTIEILRALESANGYLEEVTVNTNQSMSSEEWGMMIYILISAVLLTSFLFSIAKIVSIIRSHTFQWIDKIKFTNTNVKGTPFSFFHFIFWNEEIDLQTQTGQQIFQHELVHVKEKHSFDKLFIQTILMAFWCNPFFWLIRRELKMIHEFIADKKAVGEYGTAAFAAMILSASCPSQFNSMTNQFFQTSIKRRLAMLTKIQNPKINYFSRVLAFLIVMVTAAAFTIRTKNIANNQSGKADISNPASIFSQPLSDPSYTDTIPKKNETNTLLLINGIDPEKSPLYILNGKEITGAEMKKISPETIESINVLKDKTATDIYGPKGVNGAVEITTKDFTNHNAVDFFQSGAVVFIDGKEVSESEFKKINPQAIESVNVLKGRSAMDKYGERGRNGAIEIQLKSNPSNGKIDTFIIKDVTLRDPDKTTTDTIPKKNNQGKVEIFVDGQKLVSDEVRVTTITIEQAKKLKYPVVVDGMLRGQINEINLDESKIESISIAYGYPLVKEYGDQAAKGLIVIITKDAKRLSNESQTVFHKVEQEPSIDREVWIDFIKKNMQPILVEAAKSGAQAGNYTVNVKFLVNKDGSLSDFTALNDPGYGMAKRVVELMKDSPKWKPAQQNGRVVRAYHTQPITIVIQQQ